MQVNQAAQLDDDRTTRFRRLTEGRWDMGMPIDVTVQQSRLNAGLGDAMISRFAQALMLSAAILVGGPVVAICGAQTTTATPKASVKFTAAQMLDRQEIAVTVITKSYTALPKEARGRSTPFLKGLIDVANAYRDVTVASKARDNRKMGAALPKVATALAKLNSAYQLAGIRDPNIASSLKSLNALWKSYLKVVNVGAPRKPGNQATTSTRKISHMRRELMRRGASQQGDRRAAAQRAHLLALLNEADAASRQADQLWYASILMAEVFGYYAGAYEYYLAYEPAYAVDYRESWQTISTETTYFYSESVSYYEEYSWSSYEETVEVSESYEFGLTEQELTAAQTQVETTGVSVGAEAESLYQSSEERQTLDSVETKIDAKEATSTEAPAPEPVAEPESDAVAPDATGDQPAEGEAPDTNGGPTDRSDETGQGTDQSQPGADACAGDNPPQDCATAPADDGATQNVATPDGQSQDEVSPDQAQPDAQQQEEATPDDSGASGDNASQPDENGDACAGDNPPADCFSNNEAASDEGSAGDEGASGGEGGGDDQISEEPAQDDPAVEDSSSDDSSAGEDSSGGDDSGGGGEEE